MKKTRRKYSTKPGNVHAYSDTMIVPVIAEPWLSSCVAFNGRSFERGNEASRAYFSCGGKEGKQGENHRCATRTARYLGHALGIPEMEPNNFELSPTRHGDTAGKYIPSSFCLRSSLSRRLFRSPSVIEISILGIASRESSDIPKRINLRTRRDASIHERSIIQSNSARFRCAIVGNNERRKREREKKKKKKKRESTSARRDVTLCRHKAWHFISLLINNIVVFVVSRPLISR